MSGRRSHPRGPRRYRLTYEWQDPKRDYEWRKATKAYSSPGRRDDEVQYLRRVGYVRNVEPHDAVVL